MATKQELLKELDELVQVAVDQDYFYKRSNEYLYKGLTGVYLWWRRARDEDKLLEEQYEKYNIRSRDDGGEEKFTRVLRLVWRLDWDDLSKANLQQWSLALRELHKEFETNAPAYKTDAQNKLVLFIESQGGIRKLIGADKYDAQNDGANTEAKSKRKGGGRSAEQQDLIDKKHLELGETYYANSARSIANIVTTKPIPVNRKGYAIALIRQKAANRYEVLGSVNDEAQITRAIISSYKRSNDAAPTIMQLLAEIISTQSLPITLEKHRYTLADATKQKGEDGTLVRQNKRVLFRKKFGDIVLSENRTACSVVTVVKPKSAAIVASKDVFLNVNDRRYIEQAIIQQGDLSLYKANGDDKIPAVRSGIAASHKLIVENKVTDKKRGLHFYELETVGETSRPQADIATNYHTAPTWQASVDRLWLENLNALFVSGWLREYGEHITRPKHKTMQFEFGIAGLVIKHYGENGNFSTPSRKFDVSSVTKASKFSKPIFLAKDILPVLDGMLHGDITSKVTLAVNDDVLVIGYQTSLASYSIAIPTCTKKGKRNRAAFAAYGG